MSKKQNIVYLGFKDESIIDENRNDVNYMTNKIGGKPICHPNSNIIFPSQCNVCGLQRPLLIQCYAPLSNSPYHRTLYVFACINPGCWNNSNSWSCFRSQFLDKKFDDKLKASQVSVAKDTASSNVKSTDSWCSGADEWGDDCEDSMEFNKCSSESTNDQNVSVNSNARMSDSEDDSCNMDDLDSNIGNLTIDNIPNQVATAEIEKGMEEDIIVDELRLPENNLLNLLCQIPELPEELKTGDTVNFEAKYIAVEEEYSADENKSDHVQNLLKRYQAENSEDYQTMNIKSQSKGKKSEEGEEYEKTIPKHGNELFHYFITRVQMNPSQILRYSHDGQPLPMSALSASLKSLKCFYCNGDTCFELQILPTIIPALKIPSSTFTHLEFGTALIYTCKASCWKADDILKSENVFVQKEPI